MTRDKVSKKYKKREYHGGKGTRLYNIWENMRARCNNKNHAQYKDYGGRGISVCNIWNESFLEFKGWSLSNGYSDELSIDRANNNDGYSPKNCRWVTKDIQQSNTRKIMSTNSSGYRGVYFNKQTNKYKAQISVNNKRKYLGLFEDAKDAAMAYDNCVIENNLEHTRNFDA